MKKKIILIIAIIIVIIAIFMKVKIKETNIEYTIEQIQEYRYLKYKDNEKMGVIDINGNIIIDAQYKDIIIPNPGKDVFLCYNNNEKSIVLNSNKETLFQNYDNIEAIKLKNIANTLCYEKTVLKYEKDGLYGIIDFNGKEITKNIYTQIENLQSTEGKLLVKKDEKYGVININGKILVDIEYDKIQTDEYYTEADSYVKSGFIVSNTTDDGYRYGYIDYTGRKILDLEYNQIIRITEKEEIFLIASKNGQFGLYKGNKELIKPEYQSIIYTDNGGLVIQKNKNYGIANLNGEIKVEPKYGNIEASGIYLYAKNTNENAVYDTEGNKIDINFNKVIYETENANYRIITILNNDIMYYGIENKEGTELVNVGYSYIEYIYEDYFIAQDEKGKFGVINSNGKKIIEFKYDLIQKFKGKNMIQALVTNSNNLDIYSNTLELCITMKSALIKNEINYVKIYNNKESKYFDKNGNVIEENSEIIQNEIKTKLPEIVKGYTKVQYSLDDVYYKKD